MYFSTALSVPFYTRGEAREALVVQAMADQDNLILPLRNSVDVPSKPPLLHWLGYFFSRSLPGAEFPLRLPSALASSLALAFFFSMFARRRGARDALLGTLLLGSSLTWATSSIVTRVDMMFSCWVSIATWLLFEWYERDSKRSYAVLTLISFCLALATLTKGPAGIALPGTVFGVYLILSQPLRAIPWKAALYLLLVSLSLSGAWYYAAYLQGGRHFLDVQIMKENVARVVGLKDYETGHEGGPLVVIPLLLAGYLPWSMFAPLAIGLYWEKRKGFFRKVDPALSYSIIWIFVYLLFFACTSSKRGVYLLPTYPALTYVLLSLLGEDLTSAKRSLRVTKIFFGIFLALLYLALFFLLDMRTFDERPLLLSLGVRPQDVETATNLTAMSSSALAGICGSLLLFSVGIVWQFRNRFRKSLSIQSVAMLLLVASANAGILSTIAEEQSPKNHLREFLSALPPGKGVSQFRQDFYALDFYLHRRVPLVNNRAELTKTGTSFIFVSKTELQDALESLGPCKVRVESSGTILYGKSKLLLLECL